MEDDITAISQRRCQLCSYEHAFRIAIRWAEAGTPCQVAETGDLLQPWRVVERGEHVLTRDPSPMTDHYDHRIASES